MKIGFLKSQDPNEQRVPFFPTQGADLIKKGAHILIEAGMGEPFYQNQAYEAAGYKVCERAEVLACDLVIQISKPNIDEIRQLSANSMHFSFLDPFQDPDRIQAFIDAKVTGISVEMIPRSTRAQKMDVLSSQASLAGYAAVILAAQHSDKAFPMMMTPAGTIRPVRVLVIGAGVAGLQAIATAKRLGARIEAYDTRVTVEEQVQSLGAKFLKINLGETEETKDGYAKALSDEQLAQQQAQMTDFCAQADIIITTAQVFGRPAPRIMTREMVSKMKEGSIIVDLAVESGGNVEGAVPGQITNIEGVSVIGQINMPGQVAYHASQMYSANMGAFLEEFWDEEAAQFQLNLEDEILQSCVLTHQGKIIHPTVKEKIAKGGR